MRLCARDPAERISKPMAQYALRVKRRNHSLMAVLNCGFPLFVTVTQYVNPNWFNVYDLPSRTHTRAT